MKKTIANYGKRLALFHLEVPVFGSKLPDLVEPTQVFVDLGRILSTAKNHACTGLHLCLFLDQVTQSLDHRTELIGFSMSTLSDAEPQHVDTRLNLTPHSG